ncbi:hypothetical protein Pmani_038675 [Petrolisthes manimaculis]|uniref:Uncharacterized protein n=1 Tax=Petrolisthes manimaculis TaxID=1843537 RepID=A0AAE1TM25_9EUCA|nr:hypothetical protein Pmani_038675 [Petrolisthes manimaculis]
MLAGRAAREINVRAEQEISVADEDMIGERGREEEEEEEEGWKHWDMMMKESEVDGKLRVMALVLGELI